MFDLTALPQTEDGRMECVLVNGFFAGLLSKLFNYYKIPFSVVALKTAEEQNLIQQDFEFPLAECNFETEEAQLIMENARMKREDFSPYVISGQIVSYPVPAYYKGCELCFFSPIKAEALQESLDPMSNDHDVLQSTFLQPSSNDTRTEEEKEAAYQRWLNTPQTQEDLDEEEREINELLGYGHETYRERKLREKRVAEAFDKRLREKLVPSAFWRKTYFKARNVRERIADDDYIDRLIAEYGPPTMP